MRKVVLFLSLSLVIGLVGCSAKTSSNNDKENENIVETTIEEVVTIETNTETETSEEVVENMEKINSEVESTQENVEPEDITIEENTELPSVEVLNETIETPVDESVWVNTNANIRSGPSTDYDTVGTVSYATQLHRIAILENGWSKIEYNNGIAFISSKLVQTTELVIPTSVTQTTETTTHTNELCTGVAKEIFDATNAEREAAGLSPLVWSDELARAADIRAEEIITTFSHTRPDGTKCYALSSLVAGENIIRGPHATGSEMVAHWMDSDGHRANILYSDYGIIGISTRCTSKGDTACQLFGY